MAEPDKAEHGVKFGCGFLLGLVLGGLASARFFFDSGSSIVVATLLDWRKIGRNYVYKAIQPAAARPFALFLISNILGFNLVNNSLSDCDYPGG